MTPPVGAEGLTNREFLLKEASMVVEEGVVDVGQCHPRHRHLSRLTIITTTITSSSITKAAVGVTIATAAATWWLVSCLWGQMLSQGVVVLGPLPQYCAPSPCRQAPIQPPQPHGDSLVDSTVNRSTHMKAIVHLAVVVMV